MLKLIKLTDTHYTLLVNGAEYTATKEQAFLKAQSLGVDRNELIYADHTLDDECHNLANFGLNGTFLYSSAIETPLQTQLSSTITKGNLVGCKKLVEFGADVNRPNKYGYTPLMLAVRSGNSSIIKYLISQGARVNHIVTGQMSALTSAIQANQVKLVKLLVENGADLNLVDGNGNHPVWVAKNTYNQELIAFFESMGFNEVR